jgi:putative transposase
MIISNILKKEDFYNLSLKVVINMAKGQRLKSDQIITLLRQIDVFITNGKILAHACKKREVEQSCYRWCKTHSDIKVD